MAAPELNVDRAAAILVDAELLGATKAAKNWSVSEATISRYRKRLITDAELQEAVRQKKDGVDIPAPILHAPTVQEVTGDVMKFLQRAAREGDHKDPDVIHAVMGGYKLLKEVELAAKSLDAYLVALSAQSAGAYSFQSDGAKQLSNGQRSDSN